MGIKDANNELLTILRGRYATARPIWRAPWQVSGHFHSGTKVSFLSPDTVFFRHRLLREKSAAWRLRRATICFPGIRLAGWFPGSAPKRTGHRNVWRRGCSAREWMSAATCSPVLNWALPGSALNSFSVFNVFFASPSSGFSQNTFKTWTRNSPNVPPRHCPIPRPPRNPGANAKS
jgi:hypothetical protein